MTSAYCSIQDRFLDIKSLLHITPCPGSPLNVTTPRGSYASISTEPDTHLTLTYSIAEGRFEPFTVKSMGKNLATEPF